MSASRRRTASGSIGAARSVSLKQPLRNTTARRGTRNWRNWLSPRRVRSRAPRRCDVCLRDRRGRSRRRAAEVPRTNRRRNSPRHAYG
jgi:hypothetical protein